MTGWRKLIGPFGAHNLRGSNMSITIDVISCGEVFSGEGFKGRDPKSKRLRMFVKHYRSGEWSTTYNKDWEPCCPVSPTVTFNIVTKLKRREP